MQAVVLAAGKSKRFYPYNTHYNKVFLKIFDKTILEHTLLSIEKSGIKDIIVIVSDIDFAKKSLSTDVAGLNIQFVLQKDPLGMGDALLCAKDLIHDDFFLLHGSHIDFHEFYDDMVRKQKGQILLLTKKTDKTKKYGILKVDGDLVTDFIEKPKEDTSSLRVIGIYLLSNKFLKVLEETPKEHYDFEKAIASICASREVYHLETEKNLVSLKFAWDLLALKDYVLDNMQSFTSQSAEISPHAIIEGKVYFAEGVRIMEGAVIKGNNYIGKNSVVGTNAIVRDGSVIGENCTVGASSEIKNTIILDNSSIHSGYLGDSIIGENNKIAAIFCATNKRMDRENVLVEIEGEEIDSGLRALGVITGEGVSMGARVTTMPGIVVGNNSTIGPGTNVMKNLSDNTKFYATFKENIQKTK